MHRRSPRAAQTAALGLAALAGLATAAVAAKPANPTWNLPTSSKTLPNGLTVVVSEDHASPTFGISVVYGVGFRREPQGRTGFAHLFEHLMFEGTPASPKGVFQRVIEGGGGINNGSTRFDYTNYIASAPVSALDAILWLEADRMKTLDFSAENLANQQNVVKEEIRVNVKNRPYGLFFWTDLSALAFDKWENAHDGYGSFADLDAATVPDVESFHATYYAPSNAVIGIAGDVDPAAVFALVEKHFGAIPAGPAVPHADVSETLNKGLRSKTQTDPFARVPGLALGWKMPGPTAPGYVATAVLGELLLGGDASRFYQRFVKGNESLLQVTGGLHWPLGDYLTNSGPTQVVVFAIYKPGHTAASVVAQMEAEIAQVAHAGPAAEELERVKTKMLSDFFAANEPLISRADSLAIRQLLTGDAATLNQVPAQLAAVTVEDVKRAAATYLTHDNLSYIDRQPAPAPAAAAQQ
jgi:predicted Zn-dependent peptidase